MSGGESLNCEATRSVLRSQGRTNMSTAAEILQELDKRKWVLVPSLILLHFLCWTLWRFYLAVASYLRIDAGVRKCGAPQGPSFKDALSVPPGDLHKHLSAWARQFGPIFWYRFGPYHVSPSSQSMQLTRNYRTSAACVLGK